MRRSPSQRGRLGWRRAARTIAALAIGLPLIAVGIALALSHGMARETLRARVERALADALGEPVALAGIEGPLYPELTLRGLAIGPVSSPWLRADRVQILCARACGAWEGELRLRALTAHRLRVDLGSEDATAPENPDATSAPLVPFPLIAETLELRDSEIALPLASWLGLAPDPRGAARAALRVDGSARGTRLDAHGLHLPEQLDLGVEARDIALGERALEAFRARLAIAGTRLRIAPLELRTDAGSARDAALELDFSPAGDAPAVFASPDALQLSAELAEVDAGAWTGASGLRSALSGRVELRAHPGPPGWVVPIAEVDAELSSAPERELPLERLHVALHSSGSSWQLERATLRGDGLQFSAQGSGDTRGVEQLEVEGSVASLDAVWPPSLAEWLGGGAAELRARGSGAWSELSGEIEASATSLRLGAGRPGALGVRLRASAGEIAIDSLEYAVPARRSGVAPERVRASGRVSMGATSTGASTSGTADLQLDLTGLELERIPAAWLGALERVQGPLSGSVTLRGPLEHPEITAELSAAPLQVGARTLEQARAELRAARLTGEGELELRAPEGTRLVMHFALPYPESPPASPLTLLHSPDARVDIAANTPELADLAEWIALDLPGARGGAELRAQITGSAEGPRLAGQGELSGVHVALGLPQDPAITGTVEFEQLAGWSAAGPPLRVRAELELDRGEASGVWPVSLETTIHHWLDPSRFAAEIPHLEAARGEQRIEIEGGVRSGRAESLRVRVHALELAEWTSAEELDVEGQLSAQVELQGELFGTPQMAGALVVEQPRYQLARAERLSLEFGSERGRFVASGRLRALSAIAARIQLDLPAPPGTRSWDALLADPSTTLSLDSQQLELAWLRPLLPPWLSDPRGTLSAELRARGGSELGLQGTLAIEDASGRIPLLGQRLGPLRARAHLEQDRLVLDELELRAAADEGTARATGEVTLAGLMPRTLSLRAELEEFPLSRTRVASFDLSGEAELDGPLDALLFSGDLRVERGSFTAPEQSDPIWKEIRVLQTSAAPGTQIREGVSNDPVLEPARGSLRIVVPPNTWVRGRGAELEVSGEIELRKEAGEPFRYAGQVGTLRGRYQLGRRPLEVERGALLWPGTERVDDPQLDVLASAELPDYRVEVLLTGPLSNPQITPRSIPELPREDVLALLLFGRPTAALEQDRAAALSSVLAVLGTELAANDLRSRIARALPFDTLSVESDDAGTGTRVEVGRYVGQGVFVRYGRSVIGGETPDDEVQLEWRLTPELSIRSETSSQGQTGADLIWRKDY